MHTVPLWLIELSALLGLAQPPFVAVLKQDRLPKWANTLIAVGFSTVVALVTCAIKGTFNPHDVLGSLAAVYTAATAAYYGFWKATGIEPKIQSVTSASAAPAPVPAK